MAIPVIEHVSADTEPGRMKEIIERDGALIIDRLAPPEQMDVLTEELAPHIEAMQPGMDEFVGHQTRRIGGLIARSPTARELVMHPVVNAAVGEALSHATTYQLHLTQIIAIGPGESAQSIHRDQWAFDFFPFPSGYQVQCNTIWAMTDFTEENGATRVVPGSNKLADKLRFKHEDTIPAEMEKGSALLYSGAVYHGGGPNRSEEVRMGANITYAVSWLRQEENQYLSVPAEVARELPVPLLRMMGYSRGAYALGYVDDMRDPLEALLGKGAAEKGDQSFGDLEHATRQQRAAS